MIGSSDNQICFSRLSKPDTQATKTHFLKHQNSHREDPSWGSIKIENHHLLTFVIAKLFWRIEWTFRFLLRVDMIFRKPTDMHDR